MTNYIKHLLLAALVMVLAACDSQLDITPKGQTTLQTVADLELLLNQEYDLSTCPATDLGMICNESLGYCQSIDDMLSQTNTLDYAYLTFDESVDRATLSQQDARYEAIYRYINYMNVIISKADNATGDAATRTTIKAQAHVLRAYFHYLAAGIYASQYDEATAAGTGCIAYVDDTDAGTGKTKLSQKDAYEHMLADCTDDIIAQLPHETGDVFRPGQAAGNAIRAKILFQMKRYSDALPYAQAALKINSRYEDRSQTAETESWMVDQTSDNNYFAVKATSRACPCMETLSAESSEKFEDGDYVRNYDPMAWSAMFGMMFTGVEGLEACFAWSACTTAYGINAERTCYMAAECLIRTGQIREGLAMVDKVRALRVEDYESYAERYDAEPMTETEAMALLQRAKWTECLGSYENFFDCKRWNTEDSYRQTITRNIGEGYSTYTIAPDSKLWVLPFPANAVRYNSTLTQNY